MVRMKEAGKWGREGHALRNPSLYANLKRKNKYKIGSLPKVP